MGVVQEVGRIAALVPGPDLDVDALDITGNGSFASAFAVDTAAFSAAALANLAFGVSAVDRARVVALFSGAIELDGEPVPQWAEHPHASATNDLPLISVEQIGGAPPRECRWPSGCSPLGSASGCVRRPRHAGGTR